MTRCENPRRAAIGLTVDGFWRARCLKEYPPAMRGALAEVFRKGIDTICVADIAEPSDQDIDRWRAMTVTSFGAHIGADFTQ